ncbi:hypothetical protein [Hymenobacter sp.]|jgi:hypothetical protein|uniref:hypothetical protein n=1 Tax=Hymenobacter sp. TaxID=1898978 RepID=UPI002ED9803D
MKRLLLPVLLLLTLGACQRDSDEDVVQPEDKDWYILTSPDNRAIQAVHGDIDGTLVITTNYKIYQTKDRGKTWSTANYTSNLGLFGFLQQQDTLLALNAQLGNASNSTVAYAAGPSHFSLDEGATWKPYRNWRWKVDWEPRIARNRVTSPAGTEYSIDYLLTPISPNSSSSYVETVGVKTSTGRSLSLPQQHQLTSLYMDAKSRLYVTGSAPVCGRGDKFAFCGEQNGTLYVSKSSQP